MDRHGGQCLASIIMAYLMEGGLYDRREEAARWTQSWPSYCSPIGRSDRGDPLGAWTELISSSCCCL